MKFRPTFLFPALSLALSGLGNSAPPVPVADPPAADSLRLGAWNIENLGTRNQHPQKPQKPADLAEYILASKVDVLALEEIHDDDQTTGGDDDLGKAPWKNKVLDETLPLLQKATGDKWEYLLTDPQPDNKRMQLTGVLWRTGKVTYLDRFRLPVKGGVHKGDPELTYWTRHPEAFRFCAGKPEDKKTDFVMIPLHMKSNSDGDEGKVMRKIEAEQLVSAMEEFGKKFPGEADVVLLGDSNINAPEQEVQTVWKDFKDLNGDDRLTWFNPFGRFPPAPFDRIFVPAKQPEFAKSAEMIHGPYEPAGQTKDQWQREHKDLRSDHLLIWCDMTVAADDD